MTLTHPSTDKREILSDQNLSFAFRVLDRTVALRSDSEAGISALRASYGHLEVAEGTPDLSYSVEAIDSSGFRIRRQTRWIPVQRSDDLLMHFDDDLVVQLQLLRPDLYFQHAAAVCLADKSFLFPAPRGHGKSTLAWALLQHGLDYSSDELGPIDPTDLTVAPFSRAICLKSDPPSPYEALAEALEGQRPLHVPVSRLARPPIARARPLAGVFFPRFDPSSEQPRIREIGNATAAARLYSNALNPLAHPGSGLDVAVDIATRVPCYELISSRLPTTCELVLQTMRAVT
jgi:hypothetical protein